MAASKLLVLPICLVGFICPALGGEGPDNSLIAAPKVTRTALGLPGDPINVGLVGTKDELVTAMLAARWQPADPITFTSSVKLVTSVVLHHPDETAPVSSLYLWKRKEDLAFEQQVGNDASRRHHVRFWESKQVDAAGRPLWLGAATFDTAVGLSRMTGVPTHHIDPRIDAERDTLINDLMATRRLWLVQAVHDFQPAHEGRNGGGDPYHTDGRLLLGILFSGTGVR